MNCTRCQSGLELTPDEQMLACRACYPSIWWPPAAPASLPHPLPNCRCQPTPQAPGRLLATPTPPNTLRCVIQLIGWRQALGTKRCEVCSTKVRPVRWYRLEHPGRLVWRCKHHVPPRQHP